jgi:uncharacterized RDD family membrane protein YckC
VGAPAIPVAAATLPNATVLRRLAAMLYESLLLVGVWAALFFVPHLIIGVVWHRVAPPAVLAVHLILAFGLYFVWFWHRAGQTLAMQTWRLKLIDASTGATLSLPRAIARYALSWPSLLFFGAGVLWSVFDRERQFLHDRLAGTRIVQLPRG